MRRRKREQDPVASGERERSALGADPVPLSESRRITPIDIQQKEFRISMRGYHEGEVDRFLDEVTEEMARLYAENKRLREDLEFARTSRHDVGAGVEADAIIRRAREQADRIIAQARTTPSPGDAIGPGAPSRAALAPFIARERQFLQDLANLIQSHAEGVKGDLRRSRGAEGRPSAGPQPEPRRAPPAAEDTVAMSSVAGASSAAAPRPQEEDPSEDRTIRELFWGED